MSELSVSKNDTKDLFLPSLLQILITGAVFSGFYAIKSVSNKLICQVADVAGEETDPTLGRLICCIIFFALSLPCPYWEALSFGLP